VSSQDPHSSLNLQWPQPRSIRHSEMHSGFPFGPNDVIYYVKIKFTPCARALRNSFLSDSRIKRAVLNFNAADFSEVTHSSGKCFSRRRNIQKCPLQRGFDMTGNSTLRYCIYFRVTVSLSHNTLMLIYYHQFNIIIYMCYM